jgi:hypothetical protein
MRALLVILLLSAFACGSTYGGLQPELFAATQVLGGKEGMLYRQVQV